MIVIKIKEQQDRTDVSHNGKIIYSTKSHPQVAQLDILELFNFLRNQGIEGLENIKTVISKE